MRMSRQMPYPNIGPSKAEIYSWGWRSSMHLQCTFRLELQYDRLALAACVQLSVMPACPLLDLLALVKAFSIDLSQQEFP